MDELTPTEELLQKSACADDGHEAHVARGLLHYHRKRYSQAVVHWERAEESASNGAQSEENAVWLATMRGACLLRSRRIDESLVCLEKIAATCAPSDFALYHLALAYWQRKRWRDAEATARRVIAVNPDHFCAYTLLANVQVRNGRFAQALQSSREAYRVLTAEQKAAMNRKR